MAELEKQSLLRFARGRLGDIVIRKIRGKFYACMVPKRKKKFVLTAKRREFHIDFKRASNFAVKVQKDPALYAHYLPFAQKKELRVRAVAISDYFNPPEVTAIELDAFGGRVGDEIIIRASDEYGVVRVEVHILAANGQRIETGEALPYRKAWRYTCTQAMPTGTTVTIGAVAHDRPGRIGRNEVTWPAKRA